MMGTWQPTVVDRSLTDSSPPASDSRTQRRLGSASARPTAAYRCRSNSLDVPTSISNTSRIISLFAQTRKWLFEQGQLGRAAKSAAARRPWRDDGAAGGDRRRPRAGQRAAPTRAQLGHGRTAGRDPDPGPRAVVALHRLQEVAIRVDGHLQVV